MTRIVWTHGEAGPVISGVRFATIAGVGHVSEPIEEAAKRLGDEPKKIVERFLRISGYTLFDQALEERFGRQIDERIARAELAAAPAAPKVAEVERTVAELQRANRALAAEKGKLEVRVRDLEDQLAKLSDTAAILKDLQAERERAKRLAEEVERLKREAEASAVAEDPAEDTKRKAKKEK